MSFYSSLAIFGPSDQFKWEDEAYYLSLPSANGHSVFGNHRDISAVHRPPTLHLACQTSALGSVAPGKRYQGTIPLVALLHS